VIGVMSSVLGCITRNEGRRREAVPAKTEGHERSGPSR
jgi:hypothetical protein